MYGYQISPINGKPAVHQHQKPSLASTYPNLIGGLKVQSLLLMVTTGVGPDVQTTSHISSTKPPTSDITRRIVSDTSIADPNQDSAGGTRVWASNEMASQQFASVFISYVIAWIWSKRILLEWVKGREGGTQLVWSPSYFPFLRSLILRPQEAILTRNKSRIAARSDGSLQIAIPDPQNQGAKMLWLRQYYAVPLEVVPIDSVY